MLSELATNCPASTNSENKLTVSSAQVSATTTQIMDIQTNFAWSSPLSAMILAGVMVAVVVVIFLVHLYGKCYGERRGGLLALRLIAIALVALVLLGPTLVRKEMGKERRSELFYLLDGSRSMEVGDDKSRWEQALSFLVEGSKQAGIESSQNTQAYRFGHRIAPLDPEDEATTLIAKSTDTRLADGLRQAAARFGSNQPAGMVVMSDGRVRSAEAVEQMARRLGETGIPIHVYPVGVEGTGGDVAVVSAVVPNRVRKFSDCEIQVFIRSFGMSGKRTQVRVVNADALVTDESVATIATVPLTLVGGAQAVSLPIHMDDRAKNIKVVIDPIDGELSSGNNTTSARIAIDNTKIRVLYLEGDPTIRTINRFQQTFFSNTMQPVMAPVKQALSEDEDIECVVLSPDGSGQLTGATSASSQITKFPSSRSTLFAFDCVILSNLSPDALTQTQAQQLADWVGGRGGGLVVVGPDSLNAAAWQRSALATTLPVTMPDRLDRSIDERLVLDDPDHAIWQLSRDVPTNQLLLSQLPEMREIGVGLQTKPLAQTIANIGINKSPVMIAGRYGRGRVVVSSVALAGSDAAKLFNAWGDSPGQAAGKLWRNIVYWATESSSVGRRRLIAAADKRFYRPGDSINLIGRAYDETARTTNGYRIWCLLEPLDINDMSLYGPVLWPDGQARTSGETGPRIAWGEEFMLKRSADSNEYELPLVLSENDSGSDGGFRVELTAFEGEEPKDGFSHGTQVDSTSLEIRVLSDPFEMRNPLPNHDLLRRVASVSGGTVLERPDQLAEILSNRKVTREAPVESRQPAWDRWWWLAGLIGLLSIDWVWRRLLGMA